MTTADPFRQIEAVGERLLDRARPLFAVPPLLSAPNACANLLLDPLDVLSGVCAVLLEAPHAQTAPTPPTTHATTRRPAYEVRIPTLQTRAAPSGLVGYPRAPHTDRPPVAARKRSVADPPVRHEPGNLTGAPEPPRHEPAWPSSGLARSDGVSEPPEHEFDPPPANGLGTHPNPRESEPTGALDRPYADAPPFPDRGEPPEAAWPAAPPEQRNEEPGWRSQDSPTSGLFEGTRRTAGEVPARPGLRLASGAGRLRAVLRANATVPPGSDPEDAAGLREQAEHVPPAGPEPRRRREVGVEAVLDDLAEELETAYARAYGSSGV